MIMTNYPREFQTIKVEGVNYIKGFNAKSLKIYETIDGVSWVKVQYCDDTKNYFNMRCVDSFTMEDNNDE